MPNIPFFLGSANSEDFSNRSREVSEKGKFWAEASKNLKAVLENDAKNQDSRVYFAGDTLCIDGKKILYLLNLDGKGSITSIRQQPWVKNSRVHLPDFITQMVQEIYMVTKGYDQYFREKKKDIVWV